MPETPNSRDGDPFPPRDPAQLERLLADRDRRITELTDQLLGVLDQLTASRKEAKGRRETQQLLHDAQRRLQRAGRTELDLSGAPASQCEVVCWQAAGTEAWTAEQMASLAGSTGGASIVWVGPAKDRPTPVRPATTDGVRIHAGADCRTLVEAWNEAMAATTAPWVWLLAPGSSLSQSDLAALAPADADPLAALTPKVTLARRNGETSTHCGSTDPDGNLRFAPGKPDASGHLPSVTPEVFAVRRAAFEVLGTFDRELRGGMAAADWCLRAGYEGFQVAAHPGVEAKAAPLPTGQDDRDHALMMTRHRREQCAAALRGHPAWTALSGPALKEFATSLCNRIGVPPHARDTFLPILLDALSGEGRGTP